MTFGEVFQHVLDGSMIKRTSWTTKKVKMSATYPIDVFGLPATGNNIKGQSLQHLITTSGNSTYWGVGSEDWEPYVLTNQDLFADDWTYEIHPGNGVMVTAEQRQPRAIVQSEENTDEPFIVIKKPKTLKLNDSNELPFINIDFASLLPRSARSLEQQLYEQQISNIEY